MFGVLGSRLSARLFPRLRRSRAEVSYAPPSLQSRFDWRWREEFFHHPISPSCQSLQLKVCNQVRPMALPNICHRYQTKQSALLDATSLANIKLQFNCPAGCWLGAFRVHHRDERSAIALRRRQYRATRSHPGREASDYGCGGTIAPQSRIGEIPLGKFSSSGH